MFGIEFNLEIVSCRAVSVRTMETPSRYTRNFLLASFPFAFGRDSPSRVPCRKSADECSNYASKRNLASGENKGKT